MVDFILSHHMYAHRTETDQDKNANKVIITNLVVDSGNSYIMIYATIKYTISVISVSTK